MTCVRPIIWRWISKISCYLDGAVAYLRGGSQTMYDTLFFTFPVVDMTVPLKGVLPVSAGKTQMIDTITLEPGGPANILISGKRLGLNILPVGIVGDDYFGSFLLEAYKKEGLDTSAISVVPGYETRKVIVLVDKEGKHSFVSMLEGRFAPLADVDKLIKNSKSICFSGYMVVPENARADAMRLLRLSKAAGITIFFDPGPIIRVIPPEYMDEILTSATVIILNDEEAALISGRSDVESAAEFMLRKTYGTVVVKAGPKGCYITSHNDRGVWYAGFKVPFVDTTGAGDSFLGAFMRGYLSGWDMETIAYFSNAAGAAKVAKSGSGTQVPTFDEVMATLEQGGFQLPPNVKRDKTAKDLVLHRKDGYSL